MEKKKLLILGGNRLNIPSIRQAGDEGFETWVADGNPSAAGFSAAQHALHVNITNPDEVYEAVREIGIQGIVTMAEAGVRTAAIVSERLGLASISVEAAMRSTSKLAMRRCWKNNAYSVDFREVHDISGVAQAVAELGSYPVVFKPDESFGGSRGVSVVKQADELESAFQFAQSSSRNRKVLVEQCISGTEYSCEVLVWQGRTSVLAVGQKVKSPLPYRVDYSVQYQPDFTEEEQDALAKMCYWAVHDLGIHQGVAHIEFAKTTRGFRLFELGARCGGGHSPIIAWNASGVNEFIEYCRMACGEAPKQFAPLHHLGGDYRFLIFPEGTVQEIELPQHWKNHPQVCDLVLDISAGSQIAPLKTTSDRSGCVVTKGKNRQEAVELANQVCQSIRVKYTDGRTESAIFV